MEKVGKTTFAASSSKVLLCAFEAGFNFLNTRAVKIDSWATFKSIVDQLKKPEAKTMYDTIAIDTAAEAYSLCEKYICQQNGVKAIKDIPWGQGWSKLTSEFEDTLRKITMIPGIEDPAHPESYTPGYGLIFLCHSQAKNKTIGNDEITYISPAMPDRAAQVVNRMVDLIGYIDKEWVTNPDTGEIVEQRTLITRGTPTILAGSRLPYLKEKIPFSYNNLVNAMSEAIEMQAQNGAIVTDKDIRIMDTVADFETVRNEASKLWAEKVGADPNNANKIMAIVEEIFGYPMKLSSIEASQVDLFSLVVEKMREI